MKIPTTKTLYCSYQSSSSITRYPDPEDPWDCGDSTGSYSVTGVSFTPGMSDAIQTTEHISVGDIVYVVYISYDSGSTFGTSGGYGSIICATKNKEWAEQALVWARSPASLVSWDTVKTMPELWPSEELLSEYCRYVEDSPYYDNGWISYHPWRGYFEHNQIYRCQEFIVKR